MNICLPLFEFCMWDRVLQLQLGEEKALIALQYVIALP